MQNVHVAAAALRAFLAHGGQQRLDPVAAARWTASYALALTDALDRKPAQAAVESNLEAPAVTYRETVPAPRKDSAPRSPAAKKTKARSPIARVNGKATRALLRQLIEEGASRAEITRQCKLHSDSIDRILGGGAIAVSTAARIRAFRQEAAATQPAARVEPARGMVDAAPSHDLLRILERHFRGASLAETLGFRIPGGTKTISAEKANRIAQLFEHARPQIEAKQKQAVGGEPLPADWMLSRSVGPISPDEWKSGGYSVRSSP